jgi:DNA polymerase-1
MLYWERAVLLIGMARTYVPLYHPAYILRNENALEEWLDGMIKAVDGEEKAEEFDRKFPRTLKEVIDMQKYLQDYDFITFDAETSTLRAFEQESMIVSVSFAAGDRSFALPIYHSEAWWKDDDELEWVEAIVCQILLEHSEGLIGQNIKFDFMQANNQWDISPKAGGDTMLVSHLLDSRSGIHGLKRLAGIHLGWYEYERDLWDYAFKHPETNPKKGGSFSNMPLDILLPYGAMDAEATLLIHDILYPKLSEKQKILYDQLILQASDALTHMQCNGIALDRYIAIRYTYIYTIMRDRMHEEIDNDPKVKKIVKERQKAIDKEIEGTKRKRRIFRFNPGSFMQLQVLYFEKYKMPVMARTDKGAPSTAGGLYRHLESKYPILQKVRLYKLFNKMLSTYLTPAANGAWSSSLDGRVRTNFNLHGTVTGRTSSSNPVNLQNIPTPEKEPGTLLEVLPIKNIFTHSYQQVQPDGTVGYIYKWTNWTLFYGGDAWTLHKLYDIPIDEAEEAVRKYFDRFPEVLDYQDACVDFAEAHGYIESPFGRREHLPWILDRNEKRRNKAKREAINMPTQSGAGDTLLAALVVVDDKLIERGLKTKAVNEVHDSIVLDVPKWEIDEVATLCIDVMENIAVYAEDYFPDIDFSWIKCPLKADVEIGTHYGTYEEWNERK